MTINFTYQPIRNPKLVDRFFKIENSCYGSQNIM